MSTLKVNKIEHTSTTDGGVSIDSSGNVTLPSNTKVGTQNLPSAGPLSNRNLIINGAMQVAQRGTTSTSSDRQTVDSFYYNFGGGLAGTQSQQSLSSGTPYNEGFRNFYRFAISTPSTTAGTYCQLFQKIEAQNLAKSGWNYASSSSYVTLSFWARSSVAQTFYVGLRTIDGTQQSYIFSFELSADTWTKVTKTIPGNSNLTFDNDNNQGAHLMIFPFIGTDLTDSGATVDAWHSWNSSSRAPDMTTTWASTNGATFDITGVQLEVGQVATPFEHRSYGDELARCQRYYWNVFFGDDSSNNAIAQGTNYNGTTGFFDLYPPVSMRTAPSLEASNATGYYIAYEGGGGTNVSTVSPDSTTTPNVFEISATVGGTTGRATIFRRNNSSAILRFSAEL